MLNPSLADETVNDATINRCIERARRMEYGGIVVANLFAFRSTNPLEMVKAHFPIGQDNDVHILNTARKADTVICGWGGGGRHLNRDLVVLGILKAAGCA